MNESCLINLLLRKVFSLKITVVNESLMTGSYEFIVGNKVSYDRRYAWSEIKDLSES